MKIKRVRLGEYCEDEKVGEVVGTVGSYEMEGGVDVVFYGFF